MSNNSSNTCCDRKGLSLPAKVTLSTWFGLVGLGAIIGNGLVLWLIFKHRSLRTVPNFFLTSLAAADFLVGLVLDPVWMDLKCLRFKNTATFMQSNSPVIIGFLWIHTTVATTFNLCCVTLDRHIAIFYPLRYEDIVTNKRCYVLIATVWFMSLALPWVRVLVDNKDVLALWLSYSIITVLIPMIIIIFCSIRNFKAAAAQSRRIPDYTSQNQDAVKRRKKNFKAAKTVSIVVGLFVASWLPTLVTTIVHYFSKTESYGQDELFQWTIIVAVAFTSSAINPWVYCLRNEEFYEALKRTFPFLQKVTSRSIQNPDLALRSANNELTEHRISNPPV